MADKLKGREAKFVMIDEIRNVVDPRKINPIDHSKFLADISEELWEKSGIPEAKMSLEHSASRVVDTHDNLAERVKAKIRVQYEGADEATVPGAPEHFTFKGNRVEGIAIQRKVIDYKMLTVFDVTFMLNGVTEHVVVEVAEADRMHLGISDSRDLALVALVNGLAKAIARHLLSGLLQPYKP